MMAGRGRAERRGDLEPAAARHLDVEQQQIGRQLGDALDRLDAVLGLADDLDVGFAGQQLAQPIARRLLVVHEQRADHAGARLIDAATRARRRRRPGAPPR